MNIRSFWYWHNFSYWRTILHAESIISRHITLTPHTLLSHQWWYTKLFSLLKTEKLFLFLINYNCISTNFSYDPLHFFLFCISSAKAFCYHHCLKDKKDLICCCLWWCLLLILLFFILKKSYTENMMIHLTKKTR